jgi:hypothetical protein
MPTRRSKDVLTPRKAPLRRSKRLAALPPSPVNGPVPFTPCTPPANLAALPPSPINVPVLSAPCTPPANPRPSPPDSPPTTPRWWSTDAYAKQHAEGKEQERQERKDAYLQLLAEWKEQNDALTAK